jgi:hypothetical protein
MRGSTVVGSLQFCLLLLCFGFQVTEAVEKYDHGSIKDCAEIAPDGMVSFVATMKPFSFEQHV